MATIVVLVLALLSSLLSSGFTCTNAVSNPYQTFLGPIGVYTWNAVCGEWYIFGHHLCSLKSNIWE